MFLIGAPRSGTTILTRLLNAHRQILLTNESAVFLQLNAVMAKSREGVLSGILFGKEHHELWAAHLRSQVKALVEPFYGQIAQQEGKEQLRYWGEKHPHLNNCLPLVTELYPQATYIYAVRDPRDAACSMAEMRAVPISSAVDNWMRFAKAYEAFVAKLPEEQLHVVRYEDLVRDYEAVLTDLLRSLGLALDEDARAYLAQHSSRDSHKPGAQDDIDFAAKSVGRWRREMTKEEQGHAELRCGDFLAARGYEAASGSMEAQDGVIHFDCNICGARNSLARSEFDRESRSCWCCGSSVRTRSIIHLLSLELFGESLKLPDFPQRKDIKGIGLSDWPGYAKGLAKQLGYLNASYHKPPILDICHPRGLAPVDFLLASEVFEHVVPPVHSAFCGAYSLLRPGGLLVLTVPFVNRRHTVEHFPELFDYQLSKAEDGAMELINTTFDGRRQVFRDLRFHGGPGETLEMRLFSRADLLANLRSAGFDRVRVCRDDYERYGIVWRHPYSTPLVARRS